MKKVVIIGGGFAGLNIAKGLGNKEGIDITLIDRTNHHLFQALLYQVATAGLNPADIAVPIRSLLNKYENIKVVHGNVTSIKSAEKKVITDFAEYPYDYLIIGIGAKQHYFGNEHWEKFAPGLKTIEQSTEIRRRVLSAFENAEKSNDKGTQKRYLTFVVVGGGPTGVELAGAIGEMSRFSLAKDFKNIDSKLTRVILLEGSDKILPGFSKSLTSWATRALEDLGVQVWTNSIVTNIDEEGVNIGNERIETKTIIWAAGIKSNEMSMDFEAKKDRMGRIVVQPDMSIEGHPDIFVAGDCACYTYYNEQPLPCVAPAAIQEGKYIAKLILDEIEGKERTPFSYFDKGKMATIGRGKAITEVGKFRLTGFTAWVTWLLVHIYYLAGFKNRLVVMSQWAWSYITFRRGSRLILEKKWRFYEDADEKFEQRK
jgi:NADH dehydrogenase